MAGCFTKPARHDPLTQNISGRAVNGFAQAQPKHYARPTMSTAEKSMSSERLSFKEMCARFDVTPRTLRYYEYIELLKPEREARTRWYTPREVARMTLILRGRHFGISLEEIRQWLLIYDEDGTQAQMRAFVDMAERQLAELHRQQSELKASIADLTRLRDETVKTLG